MGKHGRRVRYRDRWYDWEFGTELREKYHDRAAYMAAYKLRWSESEILEHQEEGMQYFVRLERRLLWKAEWKTPMDPHTNAGKKRLNSFLNVVCTEDRTLAPEADFLFVAIDFEGNFHCECGIRGYGFAKFDARDILTGGDEAGAPCNIEGRNFRLARHNGGFVWGDTKTIEWNELRSTVIESLNMLDINLQPRKVVIVGHGMYSDLKTLRYLDIDLERDLPHVVGMIDTADLAHQHLGKFPKLRALVQWLQIPLYGAVFHCAGNDAFFTMQALLMLMYKKSQGISPALELKRLVDRQPPPRLPAEEKKIKEDWEVHFAEDGPMVIELLA